MAKEKKVRERVALTAPNGGKVTVAKDSVEKYVARGYKRATKAQAKSEN